METIDIDEERTPLDRALGTVREAMTRDVLDLEPRMKVSEAARELERAGISGAPVVEHGRIVGMLTMKDVMKPAGASWQTHGPFLRHEHTLADLEVQDAMTKDVVTADPDWPLGRAATIMEAVGVNRLPVVDALERPVGILTRDDIVRAVARQSERAAHPSMWAKLVS